MEAKAAFIKFVVQQYNRKLTRNGATHGASIDKISKLLDMLDKHFKEQNCRHTANDLQEYQNFE